MPLRERVRQIFNGGRTAKRNDKATSTTNHAEDPPKLKAGATLWEEAYSELQKTNPNLISAYKKDLLESQDSHQQDAESKHAYIDEKPLGGGGETPAVGGEDQEVQLQDLVHRKLQDIQKAQLTITVNGKVYKVKEYVSKIAHFIISAKDFIGSAISAEPHAALAWAGVLVVLPILLNPITQDDDAMKGLGYISDLLVRCKVIEHTYLEIHTPAPSIPGQSTPQPLGNLNVASREKIVLLYSQILKYQIQLARQYSRFGLLRLLRDVALADNWKDVLAKLKDTYKRIDEDLKTNDRNNWKVIGDVVSKIQQQADQSLALLMETKADAENIHQTQLLGQLHRAEYAAFNSYADKDRDRPTCLEGTRVDILSQIQDWGESPGGECIFWLSGMAGTGKSTIARSVASAFATKGRLGASFFFSTGKRDRDSAAKLFTTLAFQLTDALPDLKKYVCDAIAKHNDISTKILLDQWNYLILQPLKLLDEILLLPLILVFVIDALDECKIGDDLLEILRLFSEVKDLKMIRVRIFITSRPETIVSHGFSDMPKILHRDLMLHSVPREVIEHDIAVFLRDEMAKIKRKRSITKDWPGEKKFQELLQKADRLFIYAATACRFLSNSPFPERRLSEMLQVNSTSHSSTKELDEMYVMILEHSIIKGSTEDIQDMVTLFKQAVGSIVILFDSLSASTLANLLDVSPAEMNEVLDHLHSVLDISQDAISPIQLFHLSFRDFLLDKERCSDHRFWINEKTAHSDLFVRCLKLMSEHLRRDLCNLRLPGALVSEVEKSTVENNIPLDLQYACRYWVRHLKLSNVSLCDNDEVHLFLKKHFLHWLEALSLMKNMSEGVIMVRALESMLTSKSNASSLFLTMIYDAKRFVLNYRSVIEQAPLQLYCSTLLFSPEKSQIRRQFWDQAPCWVTTMPIAEENWNPCLQTLEGHSDSVNAVAFSPDGQLLASASEDYTVKLWDTTTGALRGTLKGHSYWVKGVTFSPDGQLIASSANDGTIRLWNPRTGASRVTIDNTYNAYAVAFSPDSQLLACASGNCTVGLWDPRTGLSRGTFEGHSKDVLAVVFSPNGQFLASTSCDSTVRLWDPIKGVLWSTLEGHSYAVVAVAFSPDSKLLASGADDNTIKLWDPVKKALHSTLTGHSSSVSAVSFLRGGEHLASASGDKTVKLWDLKTGTSYSSLKIHSDWVTAVAFSPDGMLLASASNDKTVRLWDPTLKRQTSRGTLDGHSDSISVATFSPDSQFFASGSDDTTVRLWNPKTGASRILGSGFGWVNTVAFSPDSLLLASASGSSTVMLWDAITGDLRSSLEIHSDTSPDGDGVMVHAVTFSPDGQILASCSEDKRVRLWNLATKSLCNTFEGHLDKVMAVAFSPNSKFLASASFDKTVRLWDIKAKSLYRTFDHSSEVYAVAFSPDGHFLASASAFSTISLWNIETKETIEEISVESRVYDLSFSSDGSYVETGRGVLEFKCAAYCESLSQLNSSPHASLNQHWSTWKKENVLWLPPEYRGGYLAARNNVLAMEHVSGRVAFIELDPNNVPLKSF